MNTGAGTGKEQSLVGRQVDSEKYENLLITNYFQLYKL